MAKKLPREVEMLADVAKALAESLDLRSTLKSILYALEIHLKLERGTISILDPDSETINLVVAHGISESSRKNVTYKVGEGITGSVVANGKSEIIELVSNDQRRVHLAGTPLSEAEHESMMSSP